MNEELQKQIEEAKTRLGVTEEKTEEVNQEAADNSSENIDSYLEEAIKMGYNPNYQGANKKSPEQFVKDGSFFRKIESLNKKIEQMSTVIQDLDVHNKKVAQAAYERGIKEALERQRQARLDGDIDAYEKSTQDLQELNKQNPVTSEKTAVQPQQPTEEMKAWAKENESWFNPQNPRLVREADGLFVLEKEENPNLPDKELLQRVKDAIVRLHPDKFENPNKERPSAVSKSSITATKATSDLESKLTTRQLSLLKQAQKLGSKLTIQDYVKQLKITGELRDE